MRPWRLLLKHVTSRRSEVFIRAKKCEETAEDLQRHHQRHSCKKNEALEKYVKSATTRTEALATTEADFFKALLDRQEEAQKHLNELAAQLSQQNTATRSTQ